MLLAVLPITHFLKILNKLGVEKTFDWLNTEEDPFSTLLEKTLKTAHSMIGRLILQLFQRIKTASRIFL